MNHITSTGSLLYKEITINAPKKPADSKHPQIILIDNGSCVIRAGLLNDENEEPSGKKGLLLLILKFPL